MSNLIWSFFNLTDFLLHNFSHTGLNFCGNGHHFQVELQEIARATSGDNDRNICWYSQPDDNLILNETNIDSQTYTSLIRSTHSLKFLAQVLVLDQLIDQDIHEKSLNHYLVGIKSKFAQMELNVS